MKRRFSMTSVNGAARCVRIPRHLVPILLILLAGCSTSNLDRSPHAWPDEEALGYAPSRQALLRAVSAALGSHGYQLQFANTYQVQTEWRGWYPELHQLQQGLKEGRDRFTIRIVPGEQTLFAAYIKHECEVQVEDGGGATRSQPCIMNAAYASVKSDVRFWLDRQVDQSSWR